MNDQEQVLEQLISQKLQKGEALSEGERKLYEGFMCARVDAKYGREHTEEHLKK